MKFGMSAYSELIILQSFKTKKDDKYNEGLLKMQK